MKLTKLVKGSNPQSAPKGAYMDARNIVEKDDVKVNEDGLIRFAEGYDGKYKKGSAAITNGSIFVCYYNEEQAKSGICIISADGLTIDIIIADEVLNFQWPIKIEVDYNSKNEPLFLLVDNNNPNRIINPYNLPFALNPDKSLVDVNEINLLNQHPDINIPSVNLARVNDSGGSLEAGAYYLTGYYEDSEGYKSAYFPISRPVVIYEDSIDNSVFDISGSAVGTITNKSIEFELNNIDTRYRKLRTILVCSNNHTISARLLPEQRISSSTMFITVSGSEAYEIIPNSEVLVDNLFFTRSRAVTVLDNRLHLGNLSTETYPELQKYINNIKLGFVTTEVDPMTFENSHRNPITVFNLPTFMHDEVMAFSIRAIGLAGNEVGVYHIPGRESRNVDYESIGGLYTTGVYFPERATISDILAGTVGNGGGSDGIEYLQRDTTIDANIRYFHTRDTSYADYLGYWESINELYPDAPEYDIWDATGQIGTLRNTNVRHHKIPSLGPITTTGGSINVKMKAVGVFIRPGSFYIPAEYADKIQGFELLYAQKDSSNSIVLGQSLAMFAANGNTGFYGTPNDVVATATNDDGNAVNDVMSNAGNWNYWYNAVSPSAPGNTDDFARHLRYDWVRMHPFGQMAGIDSISGATYLSNQLKISTSPTIHPFSSSETIGIEVDLVNNVAGVNTIPKEHLIRKIETVKLVRNNTNPSGIIDNSYSESAVFLKVADNSDFMGITEWMVLQDFETVNTSVWLPKDGSGSPVGGWAEYYLSNICAYRPNVHSGFENLTYISTGVYLPIDDISQPIYGGDSFISDYGIRTTAPHRDTYDDNPESGISAIHYFVAVSRHNIALRHTLPNELFYPKVREMPNDERVVFRMQDIRVDNKYNYLIDYSATNYMKPFFHTKADFVSDLYWTIARTPITGSEARVNAWKTFLANDKYTIERGTGVITNLQAVDTELLIHTTGQLYITQGSTRLATDSGTVTVSSGNIFAVKPKALFKSIFYGGLPDAEYCDFNITGYYWYSGNKLFRFKDSIIEMSGIDLEQHFLNLLSSTGLRVYFAYSKHQKMMFISFLTIPKSGDERDYLYAPDFDNVNDTLSYNPAKDEWNSGHDHFIMRQIANISNILITEYEGKLYQHGVGDKGKYYDENIKISSITPIFNYPNTAITNTVDWITEVLDTDRITVLYDNTFNRAIVFNHNQCSGLIELKAEDNFFNAEGTWHFNKFDDKVIDNKSPIFLGDGSLNITNLSDTKTFFNIANFRSKYLLIKLIFSNIGNKEIRVQDVETDVTQSFR